MAKPIDKGFLERTLKEFDKEILDNKYAQFEVLTLEEYNNLLIKDENVYYIITDDMQSLDTTEISEHLLERVFSADGAHGLRYYNDELQQNDGSNWVKIETGSEIIIDTALSNTSENPVQNKAVNTAIEGLQNTLNEKANSADIPTTLPANDVYDWAKAANKPTYTASEVGAIATSEKGSANGVAQLDSTGKVPSSQLPAYVDDVLEYNSLSAFPSTGESGKIYVDKSTNLSYRWSGSDYVVISPSLALGETSSTAYAGDKGKAVTDKVNSLATVATSGSYNDLQNTPSLAKVATSGSYNDLTNKPTIPSVITVDSSLSNSSTNPVQNKVINSALNNYLPLSGGTITGNLRLKGSGNYGNILNFGDSDLVHISEPSDDKLEIKANNMDVKVSGTTTFSGSISATGNITGAKVYNAVWNADYAEGFAYENKTPEPGEIVELCGDNKVRTASAESNMVIGVCSNTYWVLAGCSIDDIKKGKKVAVGIAGQLPIKVRGAVKYGDYIICCGDGIGTATNKPEMGQVVGRAMESNSSTEIKNVNCIIQIR